MILSSNGIQIYLDRANEFIENENFENAHQCFNKVLELENDNVTALCSKGHIFICT
jgi:Flp pilus assembly protein TadD